MLVLRFLTLFCLKLQDIRFKEEPVHIVPPPQGLWFKDSLLIRERRINLDPRHDLNTRPLDLNVRALPMCCVKFFC